MKDGGFFMLRDEMLDKLKSMIVEKFDLKPENVSASTTQSELGIDSIIMVDLMMDVEERFGIEFKELQFPKNPSLNDIVDLIVANSNG
ncbi:acyl carrier protein [Lysobacter capsici]|uniref:acyl carrier protein n=1 Tax=Lysobacter capsici TaxID=435897 RepID=UPI0006278100|nr:acyl carrier protein [Lysobacter capsici]WND80498.1 acyl carrier protein [Lysobacter capsici]WND85695.1 acyl carrier protein [Lysobacter capsici]